jgi:hypothetical protein
MDVCAHCWRYLRPAPLGGTYACCGGDYWARYVPTNMTVEQWTEQFASTVYLFSRGRRADAPMRGFYVLYSKPKRPIRGSES